MTRHSNPSGEDRVLKDERNSRTSESRSLGIGATGKADELDSASFRHDRLAFGDSASSVVML